MKIELGEPARGSSGIPPAPASDVDALHDVMEPDAQYTMRQLHAAYANALHREGREPVSPIALGKLLARDSRFRRTRTRTDTLWARGAANSERYGICPEQIEELLAADEGPRYVGGPLHGESATRNPGSTSWPSYRRDDGSPLPKADGARLFCGGHSYVPRLVRMTQHYVHESQGVYLHATLERDRRIMATLARESGFGAYESREEFIAALRAARISVPGA
jgi:hypothetical protein